MAGVLDDSDHEFVELTHDFSPSPSGTGLYFLQEEEAHRCYLVCAGCSPKGEYSSPAVALITFWGVTQTIFGYPNVDAYESDPRLSEATGIIYEVIGSSWKRELVAYNRQTFGTGVHAAEGDTERFFDPVFFSDWPLRHYFVPGHDGSCQALARHVEVEVFPAGRFSEIAADAQRRLNRYIPPPWEVR